jgi:hypothetical protein|tara:strand:+ start:53 stop:250 length:198 start_codon:yes stop_codon:yes gene_type:complete
MKKAIIVEYSFMTRVVINEENENLETIIAETKQKILDKVANELGENLCEWYDDLEMPYNEKFDKS